MKTSAKIKLIGESTSDKYRIIRIWSFRLELFTQFYRMTFSQIEHRGKMVLVNITTDIQNSLERQDSPPTPLYTTGTFYQTYVAYNPIKGHLCQNIGTRLQIVLAM